MMKIVVNKPEEVNEWPKLMISKRGGIYLVNEPVKNSAECVCLVPSEGCREVGEIFTWDSVDDELKEFTGTLELSNS